MWIDMILIVGVPCGRLVYTWVHMSLFVGSHMVDW
jgi:hypothetical protein